VFGEEGEALHRKWTDKFGKYPFSSAASNWPEPDPEAEKMRYDTIKQCREALQQPTGSNRRKKDAFEQSLDDTVVEMAQCIERVAQISFKEREHLKNLVKAAADNWLEICSQRYRILVILPNSEENILKSGWKRMGSTSALKLVARPEIRRIGNAQGQELERQDFVGDWQGSENVWRGR